MANVLSVKWEDGFGNQMTTTHDIDPAYDVGDAEVVAFLQDLKDASQAKILEAAIRKSVDISGLTSNTTGTGGSFDKVGDQAVMQLNVTSSGSKKRFTIPAPVDALFTATGAYALAEVNMAHALVTALIATGITEPLLVSDEDGPVTIQKGWRRGQKHP